MRLFIILLILGILSCKAKNDSYKASDSPPPQVDASKTLDKLSKRAVKDLASISIDSLSIPRTASDKGILIGKPSKNWTSGFYPGLLWKLYGFSKNEKLKEAAIKWSKVVEKEKFDGGTHDLGFKIYCPFGTAYKITKDEAYKNVFIQASKTLSTRYNPTVGAIRSWDHHADVWEYPVIIDNMMNLEMLFEATKLSGDSTFYNIADNHAKTTLKNHFRPDNSSYHVVSYDVNSGKVKIKNTHQGLNHESDWSRGQAWGLHGFTTAYRYTLNEDYLDQAKKIATFIFTNPDLPKDKIPYWDYDAPNKPNEARDASAAAIAASGLLELATFDKENADEYNAWANHVLASLESDTYQCDIAPFFLKHSVGSIPGKLEMDAPIIYADYYYVEALLRKQQLDIKSTLPLPNN